MIGSDKKGIFLEHEIGGFNPLYLEIQVVEPHFFISTVQRTQV